MKVEMVWNYDEDQIALLVTETKSRIVVKLILERGECDPLALMLNAMDANGGPPQRLTGHFEEYYRIDGEEVVAEPVAVTPNISESI